jgi:streptogramin lyase
VQRAKRWWVGLTGAVLLATLGVLVGAGPAAAQACATHVLHPANVAQPTSIVTGPDGNLWFTSSANDRIGRVDPDTDQVTIFSGVGIEPVGITAGPDGEVWFTSYGSNHVGRIDPITEDVDLFTSSSLLGPRGITVSDDGRIWFTSSDNDRVGKLDPADPTNIVTFETVAGGQDGAGPLDITAGPDGNLWFTASEAAPAFSGRVGRIGQGGTGLQTFQSPHLFIPAGIAEGPDGAVWATSLFNARIVRVATNGTMTSFTAPDVTLPQRITPGADGDLWFAPDNLPGRIGRITTAGAITTYSAGANEGATDVEVGPDGHVWFVGQYDDTVGSVDPDDPGPRFVDMAATHPFCREVAWMDEQGISTGYPDRSFRPSDSVSRQAMSAFMYRLAGEPPFADPATPTFGDVSASNPFFTEIEWMASEGITTGTPASPKPLYKPSSPVSRGAMAAFMHRLAGEPPFSPPASPSFSDVGGGHAFFLEVEWLASEEISTGYPDGTFRPGAAVTRQGHERLHAAPGATPRALSRSPDGAPPDHDRPDHARSADGQRAGPFRTPPRGVELLDGLDARGEPCLTLHGADEALDDVGVVTHLVQRLNEGPALVAFEHLDRSLLGRGIAGPAGLVPRREPAARHVLGEAECDLALVGEVHRLVALQLEAHGQGDAYEQPVDHGRDLLGLDCGGRHRGPPFAFGDESQRSQGLERGGLVWHVELRCGHGQAVDAPQCDPLGAPRAGEDRGAGSVHVDVVEPLVEPTGLRLHLLFEEVAREPTHTEGVPSVLEGDAPAARRVAGAGVGHLPAVEQVVRGDATRGMGADGLVALGEQPDGGPSPHGDDQHGGGGQPTTRWRASVGDLGLQRDLAVVARQDVFAERSEGGIELGAPEPIERLRRKRVREADLIQRAHASPPVCVDRLGSRVSSLRSRARARWSRDRAVTGETSNTIATSVGVNPSHATSCSSSRSVSPSRPNADDTAASASVVAVAADGGGSVLARRALRRARRRSPRRWFASTRRATPISQGRVAAASGTSSRRRQATRNVSATTSAAASGVARRKA